MLNTSILAIKHDGTVCGTLARWHGHMLAVIKRRIGYCNNFWYIGPILELRRQFLLPAVTYVVRVC